MLKDRGRVALRPVAAEATTAKSESPQGRSDTPAELPVAPGKTPSDIPAERTAAPAKTPQSPARRRVRWALFALLPLAQVPAALRALIDMIRAPHGSAPAESLADNPFVAD